MTQSLCVHTTLNPAEFKNFLSELRSTWPDCETAIHFDEMDCDLKLDAAILKKEYRLNFEPLSCIHIDLKKPYKWDLVSKFCLFLYFYIGRQNCSIMNPEGSYYNFLSVEHNLVESPTFEETFSKFLEDIALLKK